MEQGFLKVKESFFLFIFPFFYVSIPQFHFQNEKLLSVKSGMEKSKEILQTLLKFVAFVLFDERGFNKKSSSTLWVW